MSPKAPRNISGKDLIKVLSKFGYKIVRQNGSHIRLSINIEDNIKHITVPNHDPIKLGTLMAIINDVALQLSINKEDILKKL